MKRLLSLFTVILLLFFSIGCSNVLIGNNQELAENISPLEDQEIMDSAEQTSSTHHYFNNTQEVINYVESKLGSGTWEWNTSGANFVVIRGAGAGYKPSSSEHSYDDLFVVACSNGAVYEYTYGNSEGTTNSYYVNKYGYNKYIDPNEHTYCTPALAPGKYKFKVGTHPSTGGYKALNVYSYSNSRYNLTTQRRSGKYGNYFVSGVNVHKGGNSWNYSVGCITLHYSQYTSFIGKFTSGKWGRFYLIGDYNSKNNISEPSSFPKPFYRTLKKISPMLHGDDVKLMQLMYNDWVKSIGSSNLTITADGYYGNDSNNAMIKFQNYYGLTADGIAGKNTLNKLVEKFVNISSYYSPWYRLLKKTSPLMHGSDITALQQAYNAWASINGKASITADGYFGTQCDSAVRIFQQAESSILGSADGLAGKKTTRLLWVRAF